MKHTHECPQCGCKFAAAILSAPPEVGAPTPKNVTEAFERWMDATYPDWRKVEMRFHSGALYDAYRAALSPQKEST